VAFAHAGRRFEIAFAVVPGEQHRVSVQLLPGDGGRQLQRGVEVEVEFGGVEAQGFQELCRGFQLLLSFSQKIFEADPFSALAGC
jgi:hypothetical protein